MYTARECLSLFSRQPRCARRTNRELSTLSVGRSVARDHSRRGSGGKVALIDAGLLTGGSRGVMEIFGSDDGAGLTGWSNLVVGMAEL